jgi:hypothetical protein
MIVVLTEVSAESRRTHAAGRLGQVATVAGWILVAAMIAASYVGHSSSPYGTCYNASGRGIQCLPGRR